MRKNMIIGILVATLLAGYASAETYECKVKARGPDFGWIPVVKGQNSGKDSNGCSVGVSVKQRYWS